MRERLNKYKGYARKAMTAETRSVNERGDDTWQLHGRVLRRKSKNRRARRSNSGRSTAGGRTQRSSCQAPAAGLKRPGRSFFRRDAVKHARPPKITRTQRNFLTTRDFFRTFIGNAACPQGVPLLQSLFFNPSEKQQIHNRKTDNDEPVVHAEHVRKRYLPEISPSGSRLRS